MKFKMLMFIAIFLLAAVAVGAVSATSNDTDALSFDEIDEEIGLSDIGDEIGSKQTASATVSSYDGLFKKIDEAKNVKCDEYTINLKSGTYKATKDMIKWASGDAAGTKTLIINGNGATLDGNNKCGFLEVEMDYTLVLNNLRIQNYAKSGDSGYVDLIYGGAVFVDVRGTLIVNNCEFINNHANEGGAIYSEGILLVRNSLFTGNVADTQGGAIKTSGGKCDIQNSNFISNNAKSSGGALYTGSNGAIISGNLFARNGANLGGAICNGFIRSTPYGSAIYDRWGNRIDGSSTPYGMDSEISKNKFSYNTAQKGSAIHNIVYSALIDSNIFKSNKATESAGSAIVNTASNVEISNNNPQDTSCRYTVSNTKEYSRIVNNVFDDRPDTIITFSFEKTPYVYGESHYVIVSLKDDSGNALAGFDLSVNFNGVKSLKTDANGLARISTYGLNPNTYQISVSYAGSDRYAPSSASTKVVVTKVTAKIAAGSKTFKLNKAKKYVVTLKDNHNKVMKKVKLSLKVNRKTYSAKTNSKGKATFKLKINKKGKYNGVVTYPGNAYNNKVTKKVKIVVK